MQWNMNIISYCKILKITGLKKKKEEKNWKKEENDLAEEGRKQK